MKYTKDEEARAERSSVKMWPGITAGIIIGLIAFVLSFDALRLVFVACGINPYLSWGGPVCVDGTILLCTKADEAEAPAADASTPTVEQHAIPQPVMREPVIIPTLTIQPDERDAPTVDGQDEPAPEPVGPDVTAVEPADVPEEKTDDAQAEEKPKPGKTSRRGKAGADDEAWLAWIDELTAKGENPTASKAVDAGLAASGSTAKRYLARIRREHSERF